MFFWQNGSDVKWVDGGKPVFKVSTLVLSTVYTQVILEVALFAFNATCCQQE